MKPPGRKKRRRNRRGFLVTRGECEDGWCFSRVSREYDEIRIDGALVAPPEGSS